MSRRIGIDTGGTFTDLVCVDETGMRVHKVRSTPDDPSRAILAGIRELAGEVVAPEITHGSTVATNALLERKGARVALLTTAGFEDVLLIGRQTRAELYNFMVEGRKPLIEPGLTFGVHERLAADGSVLTPLDPAELPRLLAALQAAQVDSVAVCLLHSYANPVHEQRLLKPSARPGFTVSASHEILPEYREFERWSTTAVNAYVTPLMASYLARLADGLAADSTLRIMQSNGGTISAAHASRAAVQTILSGPAAGVVGAQALGQASGFSPPHHLRHGRHLDRRRLIDGAIGTTVDSRRRRPSRAPPRARHPHRRRGRRLHRLARLRRQPPRRPTLRRRRPRPRLLRQGSTSSPSPTPTCCSAGSTPPTSLAAA